MLVPEGVVATLARAAQGRQQLTLEQIREVIEAAVCRPQPPGQPGREDGQAGEGAGQNVPGGEIPQIPHPNSPPIPHPPPAERVRAAFAADPDLARASDREAGRRLGVDHKTVAAVRKAAATPHNPGAPRPDTIPSETVTRRSRGRPRSWDPPVILAVYQGLTLAQQAGGNYDVCDDIREAMGFQRRGRGKDRQKPGRNSAGRLGPSNTTILIAIGRKNPRRPRPKQRK